MIVALSAEAVVPAEDEEAVVALGVVDLGTLKVEEGAVDFVEAFVELGVEDALLGPLEALDSSAGTILRLAVSGAGQDWRSEIKL